MGVREKINQITDTTLIPLSFLTVIVGGVFWFTTMYNQTQASAREIEKIQEKQAKIESDYQASQLLIIDKLARIEGRLEIIQHKGENK